MVIPARREERRPRTEALRQLKAEHIAIKGESPFDIRHLEMDMTDTDLGVDRL
jgi:hypothetical protein